MTSPGVTHLQWVDKEPRPSDSVRIYSSGLNTVTPEHLSCTLAYVYQIGSTSDYRVKFWDILIQRFLEGVHGGTNIFPTIDQAKDAADLTCLLVTLGDL